MLQHLHQVLHNKDVLLEWFFTSFKLLYCQYKQIMNDPLLKE